MAPLNELPFVKGHGSGNDFVIVRDLDNRVDLTPERVRFLCDRRRGIGADGVLRVVRTESVPELTASAGAAEFFMDYRNADGSLAEMCGNGARVFIRYLDAVGLVTDAEVTFATRGGLHTATINADLTVTIDMGHAAPLAAEAHPRVQVGAHDWPAVGVAVPNPHAVVFVDDLEDAGSLRDAPIVTPANAFPDGVNVEFVVRHSDTRIAMRVHERGVGETLSCGTGACAAAWAAQGGEAGSPGEVVVEVPGGVVAVTRTDDGRLLLTGPADLVARGTVLLPA